MNPDLERLCRAMQRAATKHGDGVRMDHLALAMLEETKTPSHNVSMAMFSMLKKLTGKDPTPADVIVVSAGLFSAIAAYKGSDEDEDD